MDRERPGDGWAADPPDLNICQCGATFAEHCRECGACPGDHWGMCSKDPGRYHFSRERPSGGW